MARDYLFSGGGAVIWYVKTKNLGKDVGGAVKDFKKSMRDETEEMRNYTPRARLMQK